MGYYSDFKGCYYFDGILTEDQENKLRDFLFEFVEWSCIRYRDGECYHAEDEQLLLPAAYNMKAYEFNEELAKVVKWCKENGYPELHGEVERKGEADDDFEKITVEDGRVLSYAGHVEYGRPLEISATETKEEEK